MPVTEAIQLFRINREYRVVMFQEGFDYRSPWNFDGNSEFASCAIGQFLQVATEFDYARATMFYATLADLPSVCVQHGVDPTLLSPGAIFSLHAGRS
jgi:hypothetical protein